MKRSIRKLSKYSASMAAALAEAARLLRDVPATRRSGVLVRALACFPEISVEASFGSGPLRVALSAVWEEMAGTMLPIEFLRRRLERPDDSTTVSAICEMTIANSGGEVKERLITIN